RLPRLCIILVVKIEIGQLFQIPRRRVVQNLRLQRLDPRSSSQSLKRYPQQSHIRKHFRQNIHSRSQHSADNDNPQPVVVRPPLDEMPDRNPLQDQPPWIVQMRQPAHRATSGPVRADASVAVNPTCKVRHTPIFERLPCLTIHTSRRLHSSLTSSSSYGWNENGRKESLKWPKRSPAPCKARPPATLASTCDTLPGIKGIQPVQQTFRLRSTLILK